MKITLERHEIEKIIVQHLQGLGFNIATDLRPVYAGDYEETEFDGYSVNVLDNGLPAEVGTKPADKTTTKKTTRSQKN